MDAIEFAIIGGSSLLNSEIFIDLVPVVHETPYGRVVLHLGKGFAFIQRHRADPDSPYTQPYQINYRAIGHALKGIGCKKVIGICSAGSMREEISVGTVVVPEDYFCPHYHVLAYGDARDHKCPGYSKELRDIILQVLDYLKIRSFKGGVYVQSCGPRFETISEIQWMSQNGHVVGMTGGAEASVLLMLDIEYATFSMVDNMANGILDTTDPLFEYKEGVKANLETVEHITKAVLSRMIGVDKPGRIVTNPEMNYGRKRVDTMVFARYVLTMAEKEGEHYLENHAVVLDRGAIVDILPIADAKANYVGVVEEDLSKRHCVMPGLINCHTHAPMTLMKGLGDDLPLHTWLSDNIWPTEAKYLSYEFCLQGTRLAILQMIKGGTTTFNDMYFFPEAIAAAANEAGIRASICSPVLEFPTPYGSNADEYIQKAEGFMKSMKGNSLVNAGVGPHAPYTVSEKSFTKIKDLAEKYDAKIHLHLHETAQEVHASVTGKQNAGPRHLSERNCRPLTNLDHIGVASKRLIAVHMTEVDESDLKILKEKSVTVVHCPHSNMKLASGFCPVQKLANAGINVALGTDSNASNNALDMFGEMKTAATLAKAVARDATAVRAYYALQMATINGAKALGLDHKIGSLEAGKEADIIAVDLGGVHTMPVFNVISDLVYAAGREDVSDVWVAGKRLLRRGQPTTISFDEVMETARRWAEKLRPGKHL